MAVGRARTARHECSQFVGIFSSVPPPCAPSLLYADALIVDLIQDIYFLRPSGRSWFFPFRNYSLPRDRASWKSSAIYSLTCLYIHICEFLDSFLFVAANRYNRMRSCVVVDHLTISPEKGFFNQTAVLEFWRGKALCLQRENLNIWINI